MNEATRYISQLRERGINLLLEGDQITFESAERVGVKDLEKLRQLKDDVMAQLRKEQRATIRDNTNYEQVAGTTIRVPRGTWLPPVDGLYNAEKLAQARKEREQNLPRHLRNLRQARAQPPFSWGKYFKLQKQLDQANADLMLMRHENGEQPLDGGRVKLLIARIGFIQSQLQALGTPPNDNSVILSQKGDCNETHNLG